MSGFNSHDVTDEIYHRIYRLVKQRHSPHTIAATLHLPVRTVIAVISRLDRSEKSPEKPMEAETAPDTADSIEFLDIYYYPKTRYAILDLVGTLCDNQIGQFKSEVRKSLTSNLKALAIRMSDISRISDAAARDLLGINEEVTALGRFLAILDPSPAIERVLVSLDIEKQIPIFGTESAFEDAAFSKKSQKFSRRGNKGDT